VGKSEILSEKATNKKRPMGELKIWRMQRGTQKKVAGVLETSSGTVHVLVEHITHKLLYSGYLKLCHSHWTILCR